MGRNLDLDNCTNKPAAVIAAYEKELKRTKGNRRRKSLGDKPGYVENHVWFPI